MQNLHALVDETLGLPTLLVYNDRSKGNSRIDRSDPIYVADDSALVDLVGREWGLKYRVRGRHAGQDPLLFLDLRNARGWVQRHAAGKSVLNLFAYTCGVGLNAAAGGAHDVVNLDFAEGNLAVGRENGALNADLPVMQFVQSDYFPAIRQWAGLPIAARRGQKLPSYPRLEQRQFDLVFLDPPYGLNLGLPALRAARATGWIVPGTVVVWEERSAQIAPQGFRALDSRRYGDTWITLMAAA